MPAEGHVVEVVRGSIPESLAAELVAFWTEHGALTEADARRRLPEVICVLRDSDGAIAGINSAVSSQVQPIGARSFWVYRSFTPGIDDRTWGEMVTAARSELERDFLTTGGAGPLGICLMITDAELLERRPEALWADLDLIYAGYDPEGAQMRLGYFPGARL